MQYLAYTDREIRQLPPLPIMGPAGTVIGDPTFGTALLRATDETTVGPSDGGAIVNLAIPNRLLAVYRERIVGLAEGRVLDIGFGSGMNLPFYTSRVTELLGLEPHPKLLNMASQKSGPVPAKLIEGSAELIPLDTESVDTVVTTCTLCTIPNVVAALEEMRRVLRPTGQLLLVEHGLAADEKVRGWQHRLTPLWKRLTGGCHLDRPITDIVRHAGFRFSHLQTGYMPGPKPMTFMYEGVASPT